VQSNRCDGRRTAQAMLLPFECQGRRLARNAVSQPYLKRSSGHARWVARYFCLHSLQMGVESGSIIWSCSA
jgi:hypothetical protein